MKLRSQFLLGILSVGLLSSCFAPIPRIPQTYYFFNPQLPNISAPRISHTLLVNRPSVVTEYATAQMAYSIKPFELAYYAHHRWIAPPAVMLQPLLVASLQNSERFEAVLATPLLRAFHYRLETYLSNIKLDLYSQAPQVAMALQACLVDNDLQRILACDSFEHSQPVNAISPYEYVVATNQLLHRLLTDVIQFVIANTE